MSVVLSLSRLDEHFFVVQNSIFFWSFFAFIKSKKHLDLHWRTHNQNIIETYRVPNNCITTAWQRPNMMAVIFWHANTPHVLHRMLAVFVDVKGCHMTCGELCMCAACPDEGSVELMWCPSSRTHALTKRSVFLSFACPPRPRRHPSR